MSAKEAQLATCELGHLHWAGHCPLTPSTTDSRSKISTSKYNIILCYIANAPEWRDLRLSQLLLEVKFYRTDA